MYLPPSFLYGANEHSYYLAVVAELHLIVSSIAWIHCTARKIEIASICTQLFQQSHSQGVVLSKNQANYVTNFKITKNEYQIRKFPYYSHPFLVSLLLSMSLYVAYEVCQVPEDGCWPVLAALHTLFASLPPRIFNTEN